MRFVAPAEAGVQSLPWLEQAAIVRRLPWVPAFAGTTISFNRKEL
jgi:hypothetical protein